MPTHKVVSIIDGQPTFKKTLAEILGTLELGGALKILSPREYHTEQQRKWYKGTCLQGLSDWSGDTKEEWDLILKALCGGNELLKKETICYAPDKTCERLTIVGVGKRNMTAYISNILAKALEMEWKVTAPDKELRKV